MISATNTVFDEQPFLFSDNVTGILTLPISSGKVQAVIMLHGFASYRDEVGGLFSLLAKKLARNNIASLRFTFKNFDLPDDKLVNSSFEAMLSEVDTAFANLAAHPQIDPGSIGILGFSLGGAVAVISAAKHPEQYKSLVTWSCAADLEKSFRQITGDALFDQALAGEDLDLDLGWRKIRLSASFFQSLAHHDPVDEISAYSNPFLAVAGTADPLSAYTDVFLERASNEIKDKILFKKADHVFNVLEVPQKFSEPLMAKTAAWFKKYL